MKKIRRFAYLLRLLSLTLAAAMVLSSCGPAPPGNTDRTPQTTAAPSSQEPETDTPAPTEASAQDAPISEGRHDREEGYMAAFTTHRLTLGALTVHMEDRIYDEALLRACAGTLREKLAAAESFAKEPALPVTVFLVKDSADGLPFLLGPQVFCTPDDADTGEALPAIFGAAFGLPSAWQQYGIAQCLSGPSDGPDLRTYYADGGHALTASCSGLHLSPVLADEETVRAARQTAGSLTAFSIERDGFSGFRDTADPAQILSAWAEKQGISPAPDLPAGSGKAACARAAHAAKHACVLRAENLSVYVTDKSLLRTPDDLYAWLCSFYAGMEEVLAQIRAEAPAAAATAQAMLEEPVRIDLIDSMQATCAYPSRGQIDLSNPNNTWHEMMHLLIREPGGQDWLSWVNEGMAEHFTYAAVTHLAPIDYISHGFEAYLKFFEEPDVSGKPANDQDLIFHRSVWNMYQAFRAPEAEAYDDQNAYFLAYGVSSLLLDGVVTRSQLRRKYDLSVASKRQGKNGPKSMDGNALSYPEAAVLYGCLAERFGADAVIDAYLHGVPFQTAFGISYTQFFDESKAVLKERYGQYMDVPLP
ncbi:MAG: hypothetical protein IJL66_07440 [Lachnospiraceae bacterium]|nr:hypothetical protein [Lachnospiraceae bacterium]